MKTKAAFCDPIQQHCILAQTYLYSFLHGHTNRLTQPGPFAFFEVDLSCLKLCLENVV